MLEILVEMEVLVTVVQVVLHHSFKVLVVMVHKLYTQEQMKYQHHILHQLVHSIHIIFQQHGHLIL